MVKLDSTKGITFLGEVCQAPGDFGEWVTFAMKVRWADDDRGWVEVRCNDQIVHFDEAVATTVSPQCYTSNECTPGVVNHPTSMNFIVGLALNGWGYAWEEQGKDSPFRTVQPGGITMQARNITMTEGAELYTSEDKELVRTLQSALNALGCDVGSADGVAGRKTKEAAMSCRKFPEGKLPPELDRQTLPTFVSLYTADDVAGLSAGEAVVEIDPLSGLIERDLKISILGFSNQSEATAPDVVADFHGPTAKLIPGEKQTDFIFSGRYDFSSARFNAFQITLEKDAGQIALNGCQDVRVERWDDGSTHVAMTFRRTNEGYVVAGLDCAAGVLPDGIKAEAELIADHFDDIAVGMIIEGSIDGVSHEGLEGLLRSVARGETKVGRAS